MNNRLRKINWHCFKASGKWYSSGDAMIDSKSYYFDTDELLKDIAENQNQIQPNAIINREFTLVIFGEDHDMSCPFITRLIPSKESL